MKLAQATLRRAYKLACFGGPVNALKVEGIPFCRAFMRHAPDRLLHWRL